MKVTRFLRAEVWRMMSSASRLLSISLIPEKRQKQEEYLPVKMIKTVRLLLILYLMRKMRVMIKPVYTGM